MPRGETTLRKRAAEMKRPIPERPDDKAGVAPKTADAADRPRDLISLLVYHGYLSADQVAYAMRICSKLETPRILLDVIKELKLVDDEQIRQTVFANLGSLPIGSLLVDLGLLTGEDLQVGLAVQAEESPRRKLGEVLVAHHFVEEAKLVEVLSMQLGFPVSEPDFADIDRKLFFRGPATLYRSHHFVPLRMEDDRVLIAFADPLDLWALDEAKKYFGERIGQAIATRQSIHRAIARLKPEAAGDGAIQWLASPVDIVNEIFVAAIDETSVSDIHMEPMPDRFRIRFRRDGVLLPFKDYDRNLMRGSPAGSRSCAGPISPKNGATRAAGFFSNTRTCRWICGSPFLSPFTAKRSFCACSTGKANCCASMTSACPSGCWTGFGRTPWIVPAA